MNCTPLPYGLINSCSAKKPQPTNSNKK